MGVIDSTAAFRYSIKNCLQLLSSKERQEEYRTNIPNAEIPSEFLMMWFEDSYNTADESFDQAFTNDEKKALVDFNNFLETHSKNLPDTIVKLHSDEEWLSIANKARRTLWKLIPKEKIITKEAVSALLLEVCPSFEAAYDASDYKELDYAIAGEFADHLLVLCKENDSSEFSAIVQFLERIHLDGEPYVKELATIGYLEGIQNTWKNNERDPEEFGKLLLPESRKYWDSLNDFWEGKAPYVGSGITES